jgi:Flp pilus assembly protein TadB
MSYSSLADVNVDTTAFNSQTGKTEKVHYYLSKDQDTLFNQYKLAGIATHYASAFLWLIIFVCFIVVVITYFLFYNTIMYVIIAIGFAIAYGLFVVKSSQREYKVLQTKCKENIHGFVS